MGRIVLSALIVLMVIATSIADLGFMHASNPAWPPHAKLHAIWNVTHVAGTHMLALGLLWIGPDSSSILRLRVAVGILLAFMTGFLLASFAAPLFGASVHPDLPPVDRPPTVFGLDGNTVGFLIALPITLIAWRSCEKQAARPPYCSSGVE